MVKIYLIRHGETVFNTEERIAGQMETDLTKNGVNQALAVGKNMLEQGVNLDVILCSPLKRAIQTAELINQSLNTQIIYKKDLQEYNCGDYEGKKISEVKEIIYNPPYICGDIIVHNGKDMRAYHDSSDPQYDGIFYPNGESKRQAVTRFMNAIFEYIDVHPEISSLGVVAHGAVIRFMLCAVCPNLLKNKIKNGEVNIVNYLAGKGFFV